MGPGPFQRLFELDRRTLRSWIALVALASLLAVLAACSGQGEDSSSNQSALAESGRWSLPGEVLTAGAKVRITYDDAPKWTGSAACSGKLKAGGHELGKYLLDHFSEVSSVGGYACRRNTADASRMSVHGTGRALDVFIPQVGGQANNTRGDKVANWLVLHATRIGVQLVIWDRSIWRANGTNDRAYGGPNPHTDHIHVELTTEASALETPWFSDMGDDAGPLADGGDVDGSADGGSAHDASTGTTVDAGSDASLDPPDTDSGTVDPADDDHAQDEPDAGEADAGVTGPGATDPPLTGNPSDGLDSAGDAPGETDSLPDVPSSKNRPSAIADEKIPNKGCSTAPGHAGETGGTLALVLGVAALLRRRRPRG